jgi:hypothetical protein
MKLPDLSFFKEKRVFAALLIVGALLLVLGSYLGLQPRLAREAGNRVVTLSAELETIESLGATQGLLLDDALKTIKSFGVNAVVISEQTIGDLVQAGKCEFVSGTIDPKQTAVSMSSLRMNDLSVMPRVIRGLTIRFPAFATSQTPRGNTIALPAVDIDALRSTAIGLDPIKCAAAQQQGFQIIARCSNVPGSTVVSVKETLAWAGELGATIFLPAGEQVLGRRQAMAGLFAGLENAKIRYASPEFTKIGGDAEVLTTIPDKVVRLHAAQAAELDKLSPEAAVERYRKAASERQMRVLLIRPLTFAAEQPFQAFGDFAGAITTDLKKDGLEVGVAEGFGEGRSGRLGPALVSLGSLVLFIALGVSVLDGQLLLLFLVGSAGIAFGSLVSGSLNSIFCLYLALTLPVLGYVLIERWKPHPLVGLALVFGTALLAGLAISGLLSDVAYTVRAKAFVGVKIAVFLPVPVIGYLVFRRVGDVKAALGSAITWGSAFLALGVLAVLGIMVARSGNDGPASVSGGEMAFRGLLESLLPVRPRTKSFLIGFPALTVGLFWYAKANYDGRALGKAAGWVSLLVMLGGIASTDVVNTFCHIHTPFFVNLLRVVLGMVFGVAIGYAAWVVLSNRAVDLPARLNRQGQAPAGSGEPS